MVGPKTFSTVSRFTMTDADTTADAEFDEIFRRYYATVYRVLIRITGSPEEAEDLAQEVFLRLHERSGSLGDDGNVGGWLYRVASNAGFNALRSRRRLHRRLLNWARLEQSLQASAPSAASEAESQQDAALVRRALSRLRERDRTVLILRSSGVSYAEIATAISVKPSSVGTILVRAEEALRAQFLQLSPSQR
ncbi:MAG: sigma-70 family RNA polymerase sigma factor [Nitrolancea sp.]